MSALTLRGHHPHPHLTLGVAVPTLAVALLTVAGAVLANWWLDDGASVTTVADDVSPKCPTDSSGVTVGLCSRLTEDLGNVQIHLVGAHATDWGADVLLEREASDWTVADVSPWPKLGSPSFGPPWSPSTAIAAWWSHGAVPSVTERFGEGAVHLRSCTEAREVADAPTGQPIRCSMVTESRRTSDGARLRTYLSGLLNAPPAVRLAVSEQPDHTWFVADVVELAER